MVDFGTFTASTRRAPGASSSAGNCAGIEISWRAAPARSPLLKVELTRPHHVIGKNTVEALQSGIIFGFPGEVEGIGRRMAADSPRMIPDSVTVISTGGLAPLVIDEVSIIDAHEPWLP